MMRILNICVIAALSYARKLPEIRNLIRPIYVKKGILPDELAAGGCIITFRDVSVRLNEEQETMDVLVPLDLDQALSEMAAKQLKRGPSN